MSKKIKSFMKLVLMLLVLFRAIKWTATLFAEVIFLYH